MIRNFFILSRWPLAWVGKETASKVERLIARGRVELVRGSIHRVQSNWRGRVRLDYTSEGSDRITRLHVDGVVSALGPGNDYRNTRHPIYQDMLQLGNVRVHGATEVGLEVDPVNRCLITGGGRPHKRIHWIGPITAGQVAQREGRFGPLGQNIPILRQHAQQIADAIIPRPTLDLTPANDSVGAEPMIQKGGLRAWLARRLGGGATPAVAPTPTAPRRP